MWKMKTISTFSELYVVTNTWQWHESQLHYRQMHCNQLISRKTLLCWRVVMRSRAKYTSTKQTECKAQTDKPRILAGIDCLQHLQLSVTTNPCQYRLSTTLTTINYYESLPPSIVYNIENYQLLRILASINGLRHWQLSLTTLARK